MNHFSYQINCRGNRISCIFCSFFFTSILFTMLKTHTWGGEEASCVVVGVIVSVGMVSVSVGMVGDVWVMVSGDV